MDLVFGVAEIAGALYMCPTSAGTACATASVAVGLHGFDTASAGLTQLITGEEALPYGVQLLMNATGLNQDMATLAYDLVAIGFELNAVRAIAAQGTDALVKQYDLVFDSVENTADDLVNSGTRPGATDAEAGGASYYDQYRKADGSGWDWPENLGFVDTPTEATIPVGTRLDRYGSADGSFMSPAGTPLEERAMAPGSAAEPLRTYEVAKPLPVIQGEVAPAFGQSGGGTQMLPNLSERVNVDWLVQNGYLKEVN